MPPEPLPWDRKEVFRERERKHERSSEPAFAGPFPRWRDGGGSRIHNNGDFSPRWGFPSEFRRPTGLGRHGGWYMYHEDSGYGYPSARGDRFLDDNGFRPMPRGDGRYNRFYRDNRVAFGQKDWRSNSWEGNHHHNIPSNAQGRPHFMTDQRSVGDSPLRASHSNSDTDQFHSKDQANKLSVVNESDVGQRIDKENSLGSLDWKPLKWSRSGSLPSRGSGFNHSSGLNSLGGESNDSKGDMPVKNVSPIQSPAGDAVADAPAVVPSEETTPRKKPRLGWGEGLAKYEKKRVEGPEENANKNVNVALPSSVEQPSHSLSSNLIDKSPRVTGSSDCSSPATPSSVACSSSPGVEDKGYSKMIDADGDANNLSVSSALVSENQLEGLHSCLEKLELNSITNLSNLLNELLQACDQYSLYSGFVKSLASNKLQLWKSDISKDLELTETEIDTLENKLKSFEFDSGSRSACPASRNSLSEDCKDEPREEINMVSKPPPLEVVSSGDILVGEKLSVSSDDVKAAHAQNKDEDIDNPGTVMAKFAEPLAPQNSVTAGGWKLYSPAPSDLTESSRTVENLAINTDSENSGRISQLDDDRRMILLNTNWGVFDRKEGDICDSIFASNRDLVTKASEVLFKLLPRDCRVEPPEIDGAQMSADFSIKERFLRRKKSLRFKEKAMALKYRAFQHLWKEDLRWLSLKNQRTKLQKKSDLSSWLMQGGNQKHRSSIRSRFSSPAGCLSLVPKAEIISFTSKLLSDSQVKIYRSNLKMPAMILDEKEKLMSRFVSNNGLVEDPRAMEKERPLINPWTAEEKEIFMDKFATYGKDFCKIASFLDHKTTADCIEFYYKNHKSECFEKTKKKPEHKKLGKPLSSSTYLVTSGKKWGREMNAASLDILGEASVIAALADEALETSKLLSGKSSNRKSRGSEAIFEASSGYYIAEDGKETAAADVLAGICGSLSSEAMSSCITSSVDPGEGNQEWKHQKLGSSVRRQLTPEVNQNVDEDTYSDESCGEMDPINWTDDEKALLVQAFSSYGKDFVMISRCVRTKSRDQCKVFFSKARKCLGLDNIHPGTSMGGINERNDADAGGSDAEDACIVETGSVVCSDKSGSRMDEDLQYVNQDVSLPESAIIETCKLEDNCGIKQSDHKDAEAMLEEMLPGNCLVDGGVENVQGFKAATTEDIPRGAGELITEDITSMVEASMDAVAATNGSAVSSITTDPVSDLGYTNEEEIAKSENEVNPSSTPSDVKDSRDEWCQLSSTEENLHYSWSCDSVINHGEFSQIPKNHPLDLSIKTEMNDGPTPCKVELESEGHFFQDCYPRKCSLVSSPNTIAELPFLVKSEGQTNNHAGTSCSPKTEKLSGNGDLKLFGKILRNPALVDKPVPNAQNGDDKVKHHLTGGKFDMKLASNQDMDGNSTSGKNDRNSFIDLETVPVRSSGLWDRTKIQTSFSSLPDSAMLLAKYPAAFANYSISLSKTEEQPLQAAANANKCNLNGACVFPPREFNSGNGSIVEYPVYRSHEGVQPFSLDMKQRQESLMEVERNGFEEPSTLPQPGKELVKLNVVQGGGDILVGGSCSGISDPVAALKLHYARTQQYGSGVHGGNGMIRDETWRGQEDVGR